MSTIADVAARAGVSKATASRALTGHGYVSAATRERVTAAASDLSYVAHSSAMSLATGRTLTVGAIVPSVGRWFFAEVLEGVQESLLEHGYDLALYSTRDDPALLDRLVEDVLPRRRFDGVIVAGIRPHAEGMQRLVASRRPLVSVGPRDEAISAVTIDDEAAARIATEHLIDLGHTEIAFLGGGSALEGPADGDALRVRSYGRTMRAAGLIDRIRVVTASPSMPGGYAAAADLLGDRRTRPTAIIGVCDEVAIGALIAARRLGIAVPTQLSIVGVDDHQHAEMFALTTIRQHPREQGRTAVDLLRRRIDDPGAAIVQTVAPSSLIVRNSTSVPQ